jgi:hypothetical protein
VPTTRLRISGDPKRVERGGGTSSGICETESGCSLRHRRSNSASLHARLDRGEVRLLTRNGLDWTHKYPQIAAAVAALPARQAYLDGELCGVRCRWRHRSA